MTCFDRFSLIKNIEGFFRKGGGDLTQSVLIPIFNFKVFLRALHGNLKSFNIYRHYCYINTKLHIDFISCVTGLHF